MQTTYPLKVQAIRSKGQQPRLYISFPLALAAAIGLQPGEEVQYSPCAGRQATLVFSARLKFDPACPPSDRLCPTGFRVLESFLAAVACKALAAAPTNWQH